MEIVMYKIEYLESVIKKDIPKLSTENKLKIRKAIEAKLTQNPIEYGKPLQYSLKGCRRLRVGDFRIIYTIEKNNTILIINIGHRKEIYS